MSVYSTLSIEWILTHSTSLVVKKSFILKFMHFVLLSSAEMSRADVFSSAVSIHSVECIEYPLIYSTQLSRVYMTIFNS